MEVEKQKISVAGGEPEEVELRFTRHGPVIYAGAEKNLALALGRRGWRLGWPRTSGAWST